MHSEFVNEPFTDFGKPENRAAMERAIAKVRSEIGREYPIVIDGKRIETGRTFESNNPSNSSEVLARFNKATKANVEEAVEDHAHKPADRGAAHEGQQRDLCGSGEVGLDCSNAEHQCECQEQPPGPAPEQVCLGR